MKYKVGDKVLVREDLIAEKQYGKDFFVPQMIPFKGQVVTIKIVKDGRYVIEEDCGDWYWTDGMFLPINKYNIGDKVLVREDLVVDQWYGKDIFVYSMAPFKGKIVTISNIVQDKYEIKEDTGCWWTEEMFSGKVSEDFSSEESDSQSIVPEGESSSDIIFTVKPIKVKLLL